MQNILEKLRDEDCSKMSLEEVRQIAHELAELLPQGPIRRGVVQDLGEVWACKLLVLHRMPQGHAGYDALIHM